MEYLVIKDFGCAKKGDIFTLDKESNEYIMVDSVDDNGIYSHRSMCMSKDLINFYETHGFVKNNSKEEDGEPIDVNVKKLDDLKKEINKLKNTYEQRNKSVERKYKAGRIPTCQKVEHDTVYFNLMKLLNRFESIINE